MKRLLVISVIINLILIGVILKISYKDKTPIFHPFDINFNMTEKSLLEARYERIPEDVYLLGKQEADTLIYYHINEECEEEVIEYQGIWQIDTTNNDTIHFVEPLVDFKCKFTDVYWRNCQINLQKVDSIEIVRIIEKYGGYIVSDWKMPYPNFYVNYPKNRMIFQCSVHKDMNNKNVLSILCELPKIN